jgi:hypothetical protein
MKGTSGYIQGIFREHSGNKVHFKFQGGSLGAEPAVQSHGGGYLREHSGNMKGTSGDIQGTSGNFREHSGYFREHSGNNLNYKIWGDHWATSQLCKVMVVGTSRNIQGTFREHSGNIQGTFMALRGTYREHSWPFGEHTGNKLHFEFWGAESVVQRHDFVYYKEHLGNIQATFRKLQATFREHSGNIQGTFREHSGNIQGTFREHSGNIQGADYTSNSSGTIGRRVTCAKSRWWWVLLIKETGKRFCKIKPCLTKGKDIFTALRQTSGNW